MKWIECGFCGEIMHVPDYDFARWSKGELVFCDHCYEDFKSGASKTRVCK